MKLKKISIKLFILFNIVLIFTNLNARVYSNAKNLKKQESKHFIFVYKSKTQEEIQRIAYIAEYQYEFLKRKMKTEPSSKIVLALSEDTDISNGFAMIEKHPLINLYLSNPKPTFIAKHYDWIEFVLFHELTHIFNLTSTNPSCLNLSKNSLFYLFNAMMPLWILEGYTVFNESHYMKGRLYDTNYEAILRTMMLDSIEHNLDRASVINLRTWPYATLGYLYGGYVFDEYYKQTNNLTKFNNINPISCCLLGSFFPDIAVLLKTNYLPSTVFNNMKNKAYIRNKELISNFNMNRRENITFTGGNNHLPKFSNKNDSTIYYIKSFNNKISRFVINNGKYEKELFKSFFTNNYTIKNSNIYYDNISLYENTYYLSDIYEYSIDKNKIKKLKYTKRGMYPVLWEDKLIFIRNNATKQYFIIYDIKNELPIDSFAFEKYMYFRYPDIKNNSILISVHRQGGFTDIALIDINKRSIEFITQNKFTEFAPKWSENKNGFYYIADYNKINEVYFYSFDNKQYYNVYRTYYNVNTFDINEKNNTILVSDLSGKGYDIYKSNIIKDNNAKSTPIENYTPYIPKNIPTKLTKDNNYIPLFNFSSPGLYIILPYYMLLDTTLKNYTAGMVFYNTNSDLIDIYSYSIELLPFSIIDSNNIRNYLYTISADIIYSAFYPDISIFYNAYNNNTTIKPQYYETGIKLNIPFWEFYSSQSIDFACSYIKDNSNRKIGIYTNYTYSSLEKGIMSIMSSNGHVFNINFSPLFNTFNNIEYSINVNIHKYYLLFEKINMRLSLIGYYNTSNISLIKNTIIKDKTFLYKNNINIPGIDNTMINMSFKNFNYFNIHFETPLIFVQRGIPIPLFISTPIQLDYVSSGIYSYFIYSYDQKYYNTIIGSMLKFSFNIGGILPLNPQLLLNYSLKEKYFSFEYSFSWGI